MNDQTGITTYIGTGYSGNSYGINNPMFQGVPFTGPIPQGYYNIGGAHDQPHLGTTVMNLDPMLGTNTGARNLFRLHGDNPCHCQSASAGCIVMGPGIRNQIANSGDRTLQVIP